MKITRKTRSKDLFYVIADLLCYKKTTVREAETLYRKKGPSQRVVADSASRNPIPQHETHCKKEK